MDAADGVLRRRGEGPAHRATPRIIHQHPPRRRLRRQGGRLRAVAHRPAVRHGAGDRPGPRSDQQPRRVGRGVCQCRTSIQITGNYAKKELLLTGGQCVFDVIS